MKGSEQMAPHVFYDIATRFTDKEYDPFLAEYVHHLLELNKILFELGEPVEGNVFEALNYYTDTVVDGVTNRTVHGAIALKPCDAFKYKRRNLAMLSLSQSSILEIGVNTGYSALLMLIANKNLAYTGVDICFHRYTMPCVEYLKKAFPGRVTFYAGDSTKIIPYVLSKDNHFDAYIIDGGHGLSEAETDLCNIISYAKSGSIICFDDSDVSKLRFLLNIYMLRGNIMNIKDTYGYIEGEGQMFFKIVK